MRSFEGRVAAVTGAASGIGRALVLELARQGAVIAASDVDEAGLAETVSRARGLGAQVHGTRVDVADREAVQTWADEVVGEFGTANLVVNNAGVALGSTIEGMSYDEIDWLMGINFWGVVHGTKSFLPALIASGEGHVVNISSVFGLLGVPGQAAYNAAKFGVRGYTDALRLELELAGHPVSATTVHPGGVKTNIVLNARANASAGSAALDQEKAHRDFQRTSLTTPERAATVILAAVRKDRRRVTVGADAKVIDLLSRLPAGVSAGVLRSAARRGLIVGAGVPGS